MYTTESLIWNDMKSKVKKRSLTLVAVKNYGRCGEIRKKCDVIRKRCGEIRKRCDEIRKCQTQADIQCWIQKL